MLRILGCLLFCPCLCSAQPRMLGLRQGLGFWLSTYGAGRGSVSYPSGQHLTWDKEAFIRVPLSRKWQLESSLLHYTFANEVSVPGATGYRETRRYLESRFSLQYDVTYPLFAIVFPQLRHMRSYVGAAAAPRTAFVNRELGGGAHLARQDWSVLVQFSYTHVVPLHRRWALTSVLCLGGVPFDKWTDRKNGYPANRRISLRTGLGYRF